MNYSGLFIFAVGLAGAAALEALKIYEQSNKLPKQKFVALTRWPWFWMGTGLIVAVSGFLAWAFCTGRHDLRVWEIAVSGIASRSVLREAAAAKVSADIKLGADADLKDMFL